MERPQTRQKKTYLTLSFEMGAFIEKFSCFCEHKDYFSPDILKL